MRNANEVSFNCTMFKKNIRAFIDDELPVNEQSVFLNHASECHSCDIELLMMQKVKKILSNLERVSISPEFDFRMKSSLRREYERLRNPLHVAKIFITENMFKLIAAPAVGMLIILCVILYSNYNKSQIITELPVEVTSYIDAQKGIELIGDEDNSYVDEVNYILETVRPLDVEQEIFLNEPDNTVHTVSMNNNLTFISF